MTKNNDLKPVTIRRVGCGHWNVILTKNFGDIIISDVAAHCHTFGEVLVLLWDDDFVELVDYATNGGKDV
jgi:hypothetical protein